MHDVHSGNRSTVRASAVRTLRSTPEPAELGLEAAVLGLLLEHHPGLLSVDEVMRQIAGEPAELEDRRAVEVAIAGLVEHGLAHHLERFLLATVAAARFRAIDANWEGRE